MTFPKGRTTLDGYGYEHQKLRKQWAPQVDRGEVICWRCGQYIAPKGERCPRPGCRKFTCRFDLGHDDLDRSITHGPEHSCCNRATKTHAAQRRRRSARRQQLPAWWPRA